MLVILLGPKGSGKTTVERGLEEKGICRLRSHTTRAKKADDQENAYYFVTREEFKKAHIVESVLYNNHFFGLCEQEVLKAKRQDCVVTLDWNGARQIKRLFPFAVTVFLDCPVYQLEGRLPAELDEKRRERIIEQMETEMKWAEECDYLVRNFDDELEAAVAAILDVFEKNRQG
jgi:guanylate kinase